MTRTFRIPLLLVVSACATIADAQEKKTLDSVILRQVTKQGAVTEESNRNVMLNAASNTGPREINIGLPSNVGGTTIMENDLPVVYYFWPELPNKAWRSGVSLGKTGLLGLKEAATLMGDFGYSVNSYTRLGGDKHEIYGNLSGSHFGWFKGDLNASGPLGNAWAYMAGAYSNFDPFSYDPGFTRYSDKTQILRAGLTKRSKDKRSEISILYKYVNTYQLPVNYAAFVYKEGGGIEALPNFRLGLDSYLKGDGKLDLVDAFTGNPYQFDLGDRKQLTTITHTFDLLGNYTFRNQWKFKYVMRYHTAETITSSLIPVGISEVNPDAGYTYRDNGQPYTGYVQTTVGAHFPRTPVNTFQSRFEMIKKSKGHEWRYGLTEAYHKVSNFSTNRSFFFQEVTANPRQLLSPATDANGYYNYNSGVEYHNGYENKITAYGTDNWEISRKLTVGYGVNLRYHKLNGDFYEQPRTPGFTFVGKNKTDFNYDWFHLGATANVVYKATKYFGLTGDLIYTEKHGQLEDFSGGILPDYKKTKSPYLSLGVYFNHPKLSIVSALTYLTRNNYITRLNLVNPEDPTQAEAVYNVYDIRTTGWTTDIVAKPFTGFSLHYLVTFQNPVYRNYVFNAFGNEYNYNDNIVLGISKVLMEIDPSYSFNKFKVWLSARYFSKQTSNLTNQLYFKGWWETFAGVNYKINKNIDFGITVVNVLNQNGAKGTINGAELITDPSPFYNRVLTSAYIRPFTVEGSLNFRF